MKLARDLLERCVNNDRRAQSELYRACYSPMMQVCMRYKAQDEEARELLNQGFLKVLNNLHRYKPEVPFEGWLKRIMINTVIDQFRRNKAYREHQEPRDLEEPGMSQVPVDYNEADKQFDAKDLRMLIDQLPPMSKQVFNLYVVDGYNHQEIAELLHISESTSRWHLSNSRNQLKKRLAEARPVNQHSCHE